MGLLFSSLVQSSSGEIPAYLQRGCLLGADYLCFLFLGRSSPLEGAGRYYGGGGRGVASEPARFNDAKPYQLTVSDDAWAALKLRVDPLARKVLDPHRSYAGAAFLCLLLSAVYAIVRPGGLNDRVFGNGGAPTRRPGGDGSSAVGGAGNANAGGVDDDWAHGRDDDGLDAFYSRQERDDDFYNNALTGDDDIYLAEVEYHNAEISSALRVWAAFYYLSLAVLLASTVAIATTMEARNAEVDASIAAVVEEMKPRFEGEGFAIEYRTRTEMGGLIVGHIRPERVVVFRRIEGSENGCNEQSTVGSPPRAGVGATSTTRTPRSPGSVAMYTEGGGTMMVTVPLGSRPGQLVTVTTPTGGTALVPVPRGAGVGSVFPVLLPPASPTSSNIGDRDFESGGEAGSATTSEPVMTNFDDALLPERGSSVGNTWVSSGIRPRGAINQGRAMSTVSTSSDGGGSSVSDAASALGSRRGRNRRELNFGAFPGPSLGRQKTPPQSPPRSSSAVLPRGRSRANRSRWRKGGEEPSGYEMA
mmetsp:Transcript_11832/g.34737  ORF Transcript_11832/g.34737 Transcript_11832/m.34737 type:complete len:530 (-) Transcript_11832:1048-2637(-)|eukprot:CAMPEP_0113559512 /NCGR_PEP_ID=MMETSP0015_2-20120614/18935_1 /TAXON_ID=2838 /ORGANISM="Odontella" /LENGTH=529 /DNA_ID=CAMNT_0000461151 /DNA_START=889 /DNA_END=2478 /DNA_ORIENTATION=- /assembly_acc=CAM_ASM_000160